jgi:hypothetical protein
MMKNKSLFDRLNNEVRRNSADKAMAFHRSSLREKALPQNACRPKPLCAPCEISVKKQCKSVSNFSLCLGVFVAETQPVRRSLLAKADQSKTTNYAKQSQFSKKSNVYKLNKNKELQRKIENGHLVKTNPNKPNFEQFRAKNFTKTCKVYLTSSNTNSTLCTV